MRQGKRSRRGQDPSLRNQWKRDRRGDHWSPVNLGITQMSAGEQCSPLHPLFCYRESRPQRGQYGEGPKSVKKNAALLHFLAFGFFDHIIGVLRGEQPLRRGSLPRNSETFSLPFWSQKGRLLWKNPIIKGCRRKVAAPAGQQTNQKPHPQRVSASRVRLFSYLSAGNAKGVSPQHNRTAGTSSRRGCARCPSEKSSAARSRCSKQRG